MLSQNLSGKNVFVTGGTGTIGYQVVRELLSEGAYVTVYSRNQNSQFKMAYEISSPRVTYINGDICDYELLERSMRGSVYVIHCAASKHLGLCEKNVESAVNINVNGTRNVLRASVKNGVSRFLLLSTDKSVNPTSVMGASKFMAERITLEYSKSISASVVRLGNVFASSGSVVPLFRDQIKNNLPLTVHDSRTNRFFITKKEIGEFIVARLRDMSGGEVFIKKMRVMSIRDLAECIAPIGHDIRYKELPEGEKVEEHLFTSDEASRVIDLGEYIKITEDKQMVKFNLETESYTREEIHTMLRGA